MLPGLVIASLAGVPLLLGAAGGVLVAAVGIALVARDVRAGGDVGVAVVVTGLFGLGGDAGAVAGDAAAARRAAVRRPARCRRPGPRRRGVRCAPACCSRSRSGYRSLAASAFDRDGARALGVRPARPISRCSPCWPSRRSPPCRGWQPAARRADSRARRGGAEPGAAAAVGAGARGGARGARGGRRAHGLLRVRHRRRRLGRSVRRGTLGVDTVETKVRHAII